MEMYIVGILHPYTRKVIFICEIISVFQTTVKTALPY